MQHDLLCFQEHDLRISFFFYHPKVYEPMMRCGTPDFGFNYGCVHGHRRAAVKKKLCRCLYSRATSFYDNMHVNS